MANQNLKYFNLTVADRDKIFSFQGNVCAMCDAPPKGNKNLMIDHDHKSGLIRGGLCFRCNMFLGSLTVEQCQQILNYLLNPPATLALGAPRYGLTGRVGTKRQRKLYKKLQKAKRANQTNKSPVS